MHRMYRAGMLLALTAAALVITPTTPLTGSAGAQSAAPPEIATAVGVSRSRVRLRFERAIPGRAIAAADVVLTMGGQARTVSAVRVAANGETAELDASPAWPYGTAGAIRMRGGGKAIRVWASPGDVTPPVMQRVKLSRRTICIKGHSSNCPASGGTVKYTVDEPVTVVLDLRRRSTDAPSLMKVNRARGAGSVRFREKIEGRRLRPGLFRLSVYAVDAAGNESERTTLSLRVRN